MKATVKNGFPMNRLVVNPGTSQSWEIQLKPGVNSIGRGSQNDFQINDVSVSGSHCQIDVSETGVVLTDPGSTNGTFLNDGKIQQATLQDGQMLRLGNVQMVFHGDASTTSGSPAIAAAIPASTPAMRVSLPAATRPASAGAANPISVKARALRLSGHHQGESPIAAEPSPALPAQPAEESSAGPRFCKFHPKSQARFLCPKCNRTFCDLCVSARPSGGGTAKTCRSCGVAVKELQLSFVPTVYRSFYASLPGAFIYPFRGFGSMILIVATIIFAGLELAPSLWAKVALYGLMFLYMQNIIHATTSDEKEHLGFPEVDGLGGAAMQLAGTIVMSFGIPIGLIIARFFDVEIPVQAIISTVVLGCLYFPMAFLAVAMKDSVLAGNPLVVIPSILKIPGPYLVTSLLLAGIYGFQKLGEVVSSLAGGVTFSSRSVSTVILAIGIQVVWAFVSLYLLTVNMRILGLMYNSKKDDLGWF